MNAISAIKDFLNLAVFLLSCAVSLLTALAFLVLCVLVRQMRTEIRNIKDRLMQLEHIEARRQQNWSVTVEAMEACRRGETTSFDNTDALLADLHSDDQRF